MANAVALVSLTDERNTWVAGDKYFVVGTVTISASPATYVGGGLVMNFLTALIKASRVPIAVFVYGISGYIYSYVAGTDASNGLLKVFVQDAVATNPLLEMANALAIPAGLSGDTITFMAIFTGQN